MEHIETTLLHSGKEHNKTAAVTPPVWLTSTYFAPEDADEYLKMASTPGSPHFYHRHGSPVNNQIASILAKLENTETALLTTTGMAAVSTTILALVKSGDHLLTQQSIYPSVNNLLLELMPRIGVEVSFVDQTDNTAFLDGIKPNTRLIYVETPSNPHLKITDLEFIGKTGKDKGIITICDNTFCSPINQRPADFGIDIIVHSATKYLGGHSDLTAGAICTSSDLLPVIWKHLIMLGTSLGAMDAWLLLRGIRTLSMRVKQINENAQKLAEYLDRHPAIKTVMYCGLPDHPQFELVKKQMKGFTGMICIELAGNTENEAAHHALRVLSRLRYFSNAASLGGVESLVVHPASMWGKQQSGEQKTPPGITKGMLRISVGLENAEDLIEDFRQALA